MAIAFRASAYASRGASTTPLAVGPPAGTASGDLLLMVADTQDSNPVPGVTVPTAAGWTVAATTPSVPTWAAGTRYSVIFWKLAGASEPAASVNTTTSIALEVLVCGFTGVDTTSPLDIAAAFGAESSSGPVAVPGITTATAGAWWVTFGSDTAGGFNAGSVPAGWTQRALPPASVIAGHVCSSLLVPTAGVQAATSFTRGGGFAIAASVALRVLGAAPASTFVPQIIWLTPVAASGTPAAPTYESSIAYASVANRPAVTGTTRPFASAAALNGALSAAAPGDLVQYTGAGILDIPGNYTDFSVRRNSGYVNVDLGLASSPNHVRFTGGGGAGLPAVGIYNSQYLRIYGGEITNPPPKSTGHDGLHIYGAGHAHDGSTNHITWWNLVVHDTVDSGIKLLPNVPFGGSGQTSADNTIADCDIEATVYMIGRDKTVDTHPEPGTGQHCCLLADTDPAGATYPSFLRNRVAIDGYNTGLSTGQGGGSIVELGFNDSLSTISGCTLILRGNNTLFNAQQQTAGNGLNLWGDAPIGCAIPFLQHSNATGSAVCNFPPGYNRSGVVVAYGRHTSTNRNAYEGVNPWQIGPTYRDVA